MNRNIKRFRLNKNGKPILKENGDISLDNYQGITYKHNGEYFYYSGQYQGKFIYKT